MSSTVIAQVSLPYVSTVLTHELKMVPLLRMLIALFVKIGSNARKASHADLMRAVTASEHPPDCPIVSPR